MQTAVKDVSELFDFLGKSEQPFYALVDEFYTRVETDTSLRALYPDDLTEAKKHLAWFLIQRFGGPQHFTQNRGAPMLRRRHVQFAITSSVAQSWFSAMSGAVKSMPELEPHSEILLKYFEDAAIFLINRNEPLGVEIITS